jgi:hypothetical protein
MRGDGLLGDTYNVLGRPVTERIDIGIDYNIHAITPR